MSDEATRAKRRARRVPVEVPVRLSSIDPETDPHTGRPFYRASQETCANLSTHGAYIRTTEALSPGRRLLVEIHVPRSEPIEAVARVAWSRHHTSDSDTSSAGPEARPGDAAIGVQFVGSSPETVRRLQRYLNGSVDGPPEQ